MDSLETQDNQRLEAQRLYFQGYTVAQVSEKLEIKYQTVHSWKQRDSWDQASGVLKIDLTVEQRFNRLIDREDKQGRDYKELDKLLGYVERLERIKKYGDTGKEGDLNPKKKGNNKRRTKQNYLDEKQIDDLKANFLEKMFPHQRTWYDALRHDVRIIIKSRQIGATYYFAHEALITAITTGKNQIFISASQKQSNVFRENIISFVREVTGVELKGKVIIFPHNGAQLHFLGTNKNTVQSYSGDLYIDECFWIPNFTAIEHVASGMAVLDDRRITYFSTPSSINHPAYQLWNGEHYNDGRPKKEHITLDLRHKTLVRGKLCADGNWRQIVNIEDAVNSGYNLVTLEKLHQKFNPTKFQNLLMCEFVDDTNSLFTNKKLLPCMVDIDLKWPDFNPLKSRPFDDNPVWIGYDPSDTGDAASLVVVGLPTRSYEKFRILEIESFHKVGFAEQAKAIQKRLKRYNVQGIEIDTNGNGTAVYQLVKTFYPLVVGKKYTPDSKLNMALKTEYLFSHQKIEFSNERTDLAKAFMSVYQTTTKGGKAMTFKAARMKGVGHGDEALATMHAVNKIRIEDLDEMKLKQRGIMEIF